MYCNQGRHVAQNSDMVCYMTWRGGRAGSNSACSCSLCLPAGLHAILFPQKPIQFYNCWWSLTFYPRFIALERTIQVIGNSKNTLRESLHDTPDANVIRQCCLEGLVRPVLGCSAPGMRELYVFENARLLTWIFIDKTFIRSQCCLAYCKRCCVCWERAILAIV